MGCGKVQWSISEIIYRIFFHCILDNELDYFQSTICSSNVQGCIAKIVSSIVSKVLWDRSQWTNHKLQLCLRKELYSEHFKKMWWTQVCKERAANLNLKLNIFRWLNALHSWKVPLKVMNYHILLWYSSLAWENCVSAIHVCVTICMNFQFVCRIL